MQKYKFKVHCERISKQAKYRVWFPANNQLYSRINNLIDRQQRTWNTDDRCWEITTRGLYKLIKMYRNSDKIEFDFGGVEGRKVFAEQLRNIDIEEKIRQKLIEELLVKKDVWSKLKEKLEDNFEEHSDVIHKHLKEGIKLYKHQITATMFLNEAKSALISHEMGLGKTLVSIAYAEMNDFEKVFVITPNSLKFNFFNEVETFSNSKAYIITPKGSRYKNKYTIEESKYIIVNYDFFRPKETKKMNAKFKELGIDKIDCLICDESHRLKNTKSNTYKHFRRIFTKKIFRDEKERKVFLSGTPMPNRAYELYTILNQISPLEFATKKHFYEVYCGIVYDPAAEGGWSKEPDSAKLEELYHNISPYTHRKKKSEVLKDLPDKVYQKIMLELTPTQMKLYDDIESGDANEFINEESENMLTIMLRLRQYTASLKVKAAMEIIDRLLEEGQKVVIMDYFKESLGLLKEHYKENACLHTGDFTVEDRAAMVKEFQDPNGKTKVFLGSIQTCNYGLTLTAASRIFLLSLPYSVGEFDQALDRLHRIGQKDVVHAYSLLFYGTIDEMIFYAIESKRAEIVKVMDNENYKSRITESVMSEVMAMIAKKHGNRI